MGEQPNDKVTDVCSRDAVEEGEEKKGETNISYGESIKKIKQHWLLLIVICLMGLAFIYGWIVGNDYGFASANSLVKECLLYR